MRHLSRSAGFTLLEIVIVVAIIAIVASLGLAGISRHTDKTRVQTAARDMAQRIAEARSLAEVAGARIGTPRLVIGPACAAIPSSITVYIDPPSGEYIVPAMLTYDSVTDVMTVQCRQYDVGSVTIFSETRGLGTLTTANGGPLTLSFAATGRVFRPATPDTPVDWYWSITHTTNATERFSYRILPSGIICRSAFSAAVRCNEDL